MAAITVSNPRSGLVTSLAWSFIVFSVCGALITLAQNVMIAVMLPSGELQAAIGDLQRDYPIPEFFGFMLGNLQLVFATLLLSFLVTFAASVGLLLRKNWARLLFVWMLAIGALTNLLGAAAPFLVTTFMTGRVPIVPGQMALATGASVVMAVIAGAFAVLFAGTAKRLMDKDIRREFAGADDRAH